MQVHGRIHFLFHTAREATAASITATQLVGPDADAAFSSSSAGGDGGGDSDAGGDGDSDAGGDGDGLVGGGGGSCGWSSGTAGG